MLDVSVDAWASIARDHDQVVRMQSACQAARPLDAGKEVSVSGRVDQSGRRLRHKSCNRNAGALNGGRELLKVLVMSSPELYLRKPGPGGGSDSFGNSPATFCEKPFDARR